MRRKSVFFKDYRIFRLSPNTNAASMFVTLQESSDDGLFSGMLQSRVHCLECGYVSITDDTMVGVATSPSHLWQKTT